ncbi:DUF1642 domain-containing protein [Lactococcus lactis]|uniref:DUF1642 domain-containing protein n=1 Tax=Lactococcus lactis TaxID=1358 RepID=UPI00071CE1D8|nr:DUF1642 domain-containing protein [Lactococcus lactis]MRM49947.1 DUF1642 domain-containing protein [Lactococcus cremoris]ARE01450.1 prophage protein [Lactococcus lactis subsp. lactis]ARE03797.1 prophage protein [Lactococcus lactis subsp. lactis]KSU23996.1 Phage protein [Lactococcus lactis subsp. lactis]MCT3111999.1 DUF1642 domain-containing protein [Lactococcus lactis]
MTKEMKRPTSHISGNSIKPALSKAVEFYTDNNRQAYECIHERDEYIDYLESKLSNARPQQALPVVPECVADYISELKEKGHGIQFGLMCSTYDAAGEGNEKAIHWKDDNAEDFARAWLDGYTVEKPQLFYLKHIDMSKRNSINDLYLKKYIHADLTETGEHRLSHAMSAKGMYPPKDYCAFTQQEIDSMETGSYELVPVEDGE